MVVFKRKQFVVLSLILIIVVAGYLQYSYNMSSKLAKDNGKLGEAVYVDNKDVSTGASSASGTSGASGASGASSASTDNSKTSQAPSKEANDAFTQAKLDKEIARDKDLDTLEAITKDANASKEVKNKAYEQMMKIVDVSEKSARIEGLIREKGYSDAAVFIGDDGSIDIIVKAPSLTSIQTTQIADIASRQANVKMTCIQVKNIY